MNGEQHKPDSASGIPASRQQGFTLVELAIALTITGIMFSGALISVSQYIKAERVAETKDKIALVQNALSAYVQSHYRLPCPADPQQATGLEIDGGNCFKNTSNKNLYWETEGILPWKELGIPQDWAVDAWQHYITYKPAPQLTVDNLSADMQDTANTDAANDTHNACRTAMWYDITGAHVNRAKALFCCNAAPKAKYIGDNGLSALSADWQRNGIVDTTTAQTPGITAGTSMPANIPVAMTGNWMDGSGVATVHGAFQGFNASKPEPPLMRATGLAVTLISHGGRGDLAFLPEQAKTALFGGASVNPAVGINAPNDAAVKSYNVWPPHIFSGVFGHPKVNDGSYNPLNGSQTASDDVVSYMRSDDLFGRIGQASCERPPAATFQPEPPCTPLPLNMSSNNFFNPVTGAKLTMSSIALQLAANQGVPYVLKSVAQRLTDDAGYNNSLGVYTIGTDGSIQGVALLAGNMHSLQVGQSATASSPLTANGSSVGSFIVPDGYDINNSYANIDMTSLQMVYDFGKADQRAANVTDADTSKISLIGENTATGKFVALHGSNQDYGTYNSGAGGNGIFHMYSNLNYNQIGHGWRSTDIAAKTVLKYAGVNPNDNTQMNVGFEDLSAINCYFTNSGACVNSKPAKPDTCYYNAPNLATCAAAPTKSNPLYNTWLNEASLDPYSGYEANIGDNDYDDVAASMSMTECPLQN